MKIKGTHTEITTVDVDISPREVIENLWKEWVASLVGNSYWYINREGFWEEWEDTHGSGITTKYREATEQEKEVNQSFINLLKIVNHKGVKV